MADAADRVRAALDRCAALVDGERDRAWVAAAAGSDAAAWAGELGLEVDRTGLSVERNVLRYRPLPGVTLRAGDGARPAELVRVLLAAELTRPMLGADRHQAAIVFALLVLATLAPAGGCLHLAACDAALGGSPGSAAGISRRPVATTVYS